MAEDKLTMFGKTYNTVGSADSNLMLLTRGDLKIRWGNKFIDLIKNGKINADTDILKVTDSSESINSDGIYLIKSEEKNEIWIRIGGTLINLTLEVGLDYISYQEELNLTGDEKFLALTNIGIIFDTYANLTISGIKNGVAYVSELQKFFTIQEGKINEYVFNTLVADPLKIGNVTIKGNSEEILGTSILNVDATTINLKARGTKVMSVTSDKVVYDLYISSNKGIQSNVYNNNVGYFVGINDKNKAVGVFDEITVRNGINLVQKVTYSQLRALMRNGLLIMNCEYEITDFQDIRNITYNDETNLEDSTLDGFKFKNVFPIIVKAKNSSELREEGYFSENPDWVIEYDPNYYHIVKHRTTDERNEVVYSKGRITKMTDEFGNTANFDFKHSTFTNDKKYLFNVDNPRIKELDKLIELGSTDRLLAEKAATPVYADATLDIDVTITEYLDESYASFERVKNTRIVNNIIYLAEPTLTDSSVVIGVKEILFNDYIIFDNCDTIFPNNNNIKNIFGNYLITQLFEKVTIEGLYDVTLSGSITNSTFKSILDIEVQGPLDNLEVQTDVDTSVEYIEDASDVTNYIQNRPFVLSVSNVPKLSAIGKKSCVVMTKSFNGSNITVFVVRTIDDNMPSGIITMFSGLVALIPSGWVICDGTNGTPDLRGRFIRMIDAGETCGPLNNSDLVSLTIEQNGQTVQTRQAYLNKTVKHTHVYKTYSDLIAADYSGLNISYVANNVTGLTTSGTQYLQLVTDPNSPGVPVGALPDIDVSGNIYVDITMTPEQDSEPDFPEYINVEPLAYALIFIMKL